MVASTSKWVICITLLNRIGLGHIIVSLDFSQSGLTEVPLCSVNQSIDKIDLNKNNIQELFPYSFNNYNTLNEISLASNGLRMIHDGTFDDIHSLQNLILNENSIKQLPANFGPSTTTLSSIYLESALEDQFLFTHPYFSAFTGVVTINIGSNNNGNFNDSFFPPNVICIKANTGTMYKLPNMSSLTPHIEILDFAKHQLTSIPQKAIAGLFELRELLMNNNKIMNFPN